MQAGGRGRAGERARLGAAVGAVADAGLSRPGAEGGEEGAQARPRAGADGNRARASPRSPRFDIAKAKQAFDRAIALELRRSRSRASASASPPSATATWSRGAATSRSRSASTPTARCCAAISARPTSRSGPPTRYLLRAAVTNFPNQENTLAAEQFAIAKQLDPADPTPWLYDAIRKQSENRPVEALRDIEKSIELNDNRAVYRSRELLDQDRASRGTSLARIYNDLGFEQLGINEATKSLTLDPANAGATGSSPTSTRRSRAARSHASASCCRRSSCRTSTSTRSSRA